MTHTGHMTNCWHMADKAKPATVRPAIAAQGNGEIKDK